MGCSLVQNTAFSGQMRSGLRDTHSQPLLTKAVPPVAKITNIWAARSNTRGYRAGVERAKFPADGAVWDNIGRPSHALVVAGVISFVSETITGYFLRGRPSGQNVAAG